jgi:hypothetical protein
LLLFPINRELDTIYVKLNTMQSLMSKFSNAYGHSSFQQRPTNPSAGMQQNGFQKVQNPSGANSAVNSVSVKTDLM